MIMLKKDSGPEFEFEFDEAKSRLNQRKHGIDFVEAQEIWLDDRVYEFPGRDEREQRWIVIGLVSSKHWSAIVTYRGERIRLISVRRSRPREVALYERQAHQR